MPPPAMMTSQVFTDLILTVYAAEHIQTAFSSSAVSNEAWASYRNALGIAAKCGRDTLADFVIDVDRLFPAGPAQLDPQAREAIVLLLSAEPASEAALEAALRLAHRREETA